MARSRSRLWTSCSSLCPGRGESQGARVTPLTRLLPSQAPPGPQAGARGLCRKLPFPSPDPPSPPPGTFSHNPPNNCPPYLFLRPQLRSPLPRFPTTVLPLAPTGLIGIMARAARGPGYTPQPLGHCKGIVGAWQVQGRGCSRHRNSQGHRACCPPRTRQSWAGPFCGHRAVFGVAVVEMTQGLCSQL